MCFYTVMDYACGDWKWGNLRERCPRQPKMGESCGTKLMHHETSERLNKSCSTCIALETKHRRLPKIEEKLRWRQDNGPQEFQYSIAKSKKEIRDLLEEIAELEAKRPSVKLAMSRKVSQGGGMLPRMESAVLASVGGSQYGSRGHRQGR